MQPDPQPMVNTKTRNTKTQNTKTWIARLFSASPPQTCLFRVDAGNRKGLSFGHLSRCIILSKILKDLFCTESIFLMKDISEGILHARGKGCHVATFPEHAGPEQAGPEQEMKALIDLADQIVPDLFIMDLPDTRLDTQVFEQIKKRNIRSICIDDFRFKNPGADIVFNSSILALEKFKKGPSPDNQTLFLGPGYFIFDDSLPGNKISFDNGLKNIVISFGGSDPTDLTFRVTEQLASLAFKDTSFHIVTGPGYKNVQALYTLISEQKERFEIIENPDQIIPYFEAADHVVCAGGRTMYELFYLQKDFTPIGSTLIEADAIQAFIQKKMVRSGLAAWNAGQFKIEFSKNLLQLLDNSP